MEIDILSLLYNYTYRMLCLSYAVNQLLNNTGYISTSDLVAVIHFQAPFSDSSNCKYRIAGNFRWVKFSFQVLKTSFRGLIFVPSLKCSIKKYTGPRRETQRTQQGLKVPEHRPSGQFNTALELLQLASRPADAACRP